jgi:CheY-like chemotaxis protein
MCKILPTILIVDDNENLRIALADIFLQFGHDVRTAADGLEALSVMRKKVPTVLISDLDMPGMSGFELLSVVRRRFPSVRVVAMGGHIPVRQCPPALPRTRSMRRAAAASCLN